MNDPRLDPSTVYTLTGAKAGEDVLGLFSQTDGVRSRVDVSLRVDRPLRAARVGGMITALAFLGDWSAWSRAAC